MHYDHETVYCTTIFITRSIYRRSDLVVVSHYTNIERRCIFGDRYGTTVIVTNTPLTEICSL
jgi:hypothetical protein